MTALSVDYPDWNPPRDRPALRNVATVAGNLAAGTVFDVNFAPEQLDSAVIVSGILIPGTAIHLGSPTPFGPIETQRGAINLGPADVTALLVSAFVGSPMDLEIANTTGSPFAYVFFVTTAAGVPTDLALPAQQMVIANDVAVPATADADAFSLGRAAMYERATITTTCDQPYTVTVRRSWLDDTGGLVIVSADELVATSASAGDTIADVPVGANGFAVVVAGTGITAGTASVAVRLYRSGGF